VSTDPVTLALVLACQFLSIAAQTSLKLGMARPMQPLPARWRPADVLASALDLVRRPWLWAGCALYLVGMVVWFRVLTRADLSFAYPFVALSYVGVVLSSQFVLRERVTGQRWLGVALVLGGLLLIASS
jgi:drug/metabolite transporter (DMT)-like permease